MAADWIDVELLAKIAQHFTGGSLVLLGKVTTDLSRLEGLPNVQIGNKTKRVPKTAIARYLEPKAS